MAGFQKKKSWAQIVFRFAVVAAALGVLSAAAFAQFNDGRGNRDTRNGRDVSSSTGGQSLDPGVRTGPPGAGGPLAGMSPEYQSFFNAALIRFQEVDSVSGQITGEDGTGLGPRFNGTSCSGCHAFPAIGGSSPPVNPQIAMANADGATNKIPRFITPNGPVREARFIRNPDGTPDGGVHNLFVITGRSDAPTCNIAQPDFETAMERNNLILRVPTPLFGAGLVESITDSAILANAANPHKAAMGISGLANRSGNDGTITRFGWKAQNKSLLMFAGEAYNVEQGVTNELFPNERDDTPGCMLQRDAGRFHRARHRTAIRARPRRIIPPTSSTSPPSRASPLRPLPLPPPLSPAPGSRCSTRSAATSAIRPRSIAAASLPAPGKPMFRRTRSRTSSFTTWGRGWPIR